MQKEKKRYASNRASIIQLVKLLAFPVLGSLSFMVASLGVVKHGFDKSSPDGVVLGITGFMFFGYILAFKILWPLADDIIKGKKLINTRDSGVARSQTQIPRVARSVKYGDEVVEPYLAQDINTYRLIRRSPSIFVWPFIAVFCAPFVGFFVGVIFGLISPYIGITAGIFTMVIVHFLGFTITGEKLQRKLMPVKRTLPKELVIDFWRVLPLLAVLSSMLILLVFLRKSENLSVPSFNHWTNYLSWTALVVLKYYIYLNLAAVIMHENSQRPTYRETAKLMKQEAWPLFSIYLHAGIVFGVPFLFFGGLSQLGIGNTDVTLILAGVSLIIALIVQAVSEQLHILLHYLRVKHPDLIQRLNAIIGRQVYETTPSKS